MVCVCSEINEPLVKPEGSNRPARLWCIVDYKYNRSHFHGGYQASQYSRIECLRCGATWRTKAAYVEKLGARDPDQPDIRCGVTGHRAAMRELGRTEHPNNVEA